MKELLIEFLKNEHNFSGKAMSEATFQFELGCFLRENGYDNLKFEHQFCGDFLKKEADLYIEHNNSNICIELKKIDEIVKCGDQPTAGVTNKLTLAFEDICYLQQLKNCKEIDKGFFILVTNNLDMINSTKKSLGSRFWRNTPEVNLSEYSISDFPSNKTWKHPKLRTFIEQKNHSKLNSKIEYTPVGDYAFCIFTV